MKSRIKEIRKTNPDWKTQDDFAEFLGISKSNLSSYEAGRRTPSDAVIKLICEKCDVNEEWLRTGNGEMFIEKTKDEQISEAFGDIENLGEDNFKHRLISAILKLDEDGWKTLEELVDAISNK
jgi:HTH-type transcriptional regulator / antitoxin PezA